MIPNRAAAGAHTTYFLARPNDKLSELPIHPELSDLSELCIVCEQEKGEDDSPLECEKVCTPFFSHLLLSHFF